MCPVFVVAIVEGKRMLKEGGKNYRPSFAFPEFILAWSVSGRVSGLQNRDGSLVHCSFGVYAMKKNK